MTYQVLARKWRPQNFTDMVGQDHISSTLCNAIKNNRVGHAYLFVGTRGTGKTTTARIFAKAINCENPLPDANPCDKCTNCLEITAGSCMDVLEIDGASNNGVEDIRRLRENVQYTPARCSYKIYIIDEVHMLSTAAWNALLKTLEEPPSHVKFFFATTEVHKVLPTILSRCQRFDLKRISQGTISRRLQEIAQHENAQFDQSSLNAIARAANGGMRDALSIMDQMIAFCSNLETITEHDVSEVFGLTSNNDLAKITLALLNNDAAELINEINRLADIGRNLEQLYADLLQFTRNLMISSISGSQAKDILDLDEHELSLTREIVQQVNQDTLQRLVDGYLSHDGKIRNTLNKRVFLEMTLIRIMKDAHAASLNDILKRLNALRKTGSLENFNAEPQQSKISITLPEEKKKNSVIESKSSPISNVSTQSESSTDTTISKNTVKDTQLENATEESDETLEEITPTHTNITVEVKTENLEQTAEIQTTALESANPEESLKPSNLPSLNTGNDDRPDYLNQIPSSISPEPQEEFTANIQQPIEQPKETNPKVIQDEIIDTEENLSVKVQHNQPEVHRSVNPLLDTNSVEKVIIDDSIEITYSTLLDEEYIKTARGKDPLQLGLSRYHQDFDENDETPGSALGVYYLKNIGENTQPANTDTHLQTDNSNFQIETSTEEIPVQIPEAPAKSFATIPNQQTPEEDISQNSPTEAIDNQAVEVPTQVVEVPTQDAEVPTQDAEVPTQIVEAPTQDIEVPTQTLSSETSQQKIESPEETAQQIWEQSKSHWSQQTPDIKNQLSALTPISCDLTTFILATENPEGLTPTLNGAISTLLKFVSPNQEREIKIVKAVANSTDSAKQLTSGDDVWKRVNETPFFKQVCNEFDGTIIDVRG